MATRDSENDGARERRESSTKRQAMTCICNSATECRGISAVFKVMKDKRGGFVELPPNLSESIESDPSLYYLRLAYCKALNVTPRNVDINQRHFLAIHHFHPSILDDAEPDPDDSRLYIVCRTIDQISIQSLNLTATDPVMDDEGRPTEQFYVVPNYPFHLVKNDAKKIFQQNKQKSAAASASGGPPPRGPAPAPQTSPPPSKRPSAPSTSAKAMDVIATSPPKPSSEKPDPEEFLSSRWSDSPRESPKPISSQESFMSTSNDSSSSHIASTPTCICSSPTECRGVTAIFKVFKDQRGGFSELPPTHAERLGEHRHLWYLRMACLRHLKVDPSKVSVHQRHFVALHHYPPYIADDAKKDPADPRIFFVARTIDESSTKALKLNFTEQDREMDETGRPTEQYFVVPNYSFASAQNDAKRLFLKRNTQKQKGQEQHQSSDTSPATKKPFTSTHTVQSTATSSSVLSPSLKFAQSGPPVQSQKTSPSKSPPNTLCVSTGKVEDEVQTTSVSQAHPQASSPVVQPANTQTSSKVSALEGEPEQPNPQLAPVPSTRAEAGRKRQDELEAEKAETQQKRQEAAAAKATESEQKRQAKMDAERKLQEDVVAERAEAERQRTQKLDAEQKRQAEMASKAAEAENEKKRKDEIAARKAENEYQQQIENARWERVEDEKNRQQEFAAKEAETQRRRQIDLEDSSRQQDNMIERLGSDEMKRRKEDANGAFESERMRQGKLTAQQTDPDSNRQHLLNSAGAIEVDRTRQEGLAAQKAESDTNRQVQTLKPAAQVKGERQEINTAESDSPTKAASPVVTQSLAAGALASVAGAWSAIFASAAATEPSDSDASSSASVGTSITASSFDVRLERALGPDSISSSSGARSRVEQSFVDTDGRTTSDDASATLVEMDETTKTPITRVTKVSSAVAQASSDLPQLPQLAAATDDERELPSSTRRDSIEAGGDLSQVNSTRNTDSTGALVSDSEDNLTEDDDSTMEAFMDETSQLKHSESSSTEFISEGDTIATSDSTQLRQLLAFKSVNLTRMDRSEAAAFMAAIENRRRTWAMAELEKMRAEWTCHRDVIRNMVRESKYIENLLADALKSMELYSGCLQAAKDDCLIDDEGEIVAFPHKRKRLANKRLSNLPLLSNERSSLIKPIFDAMYESIRKINESIPQLRSEARAMKELHEELSSRSGVLAAKGAGIMFTLSFAESQMQDTWDRLEEVVNCDSCNSAAQDRWLAEASYKNAVKQGMSLWSAQCCDLDQVCADVIRLESQRRGRTKEIILAFLPRRRKLFVRLLEDFAQSYSQLEDNRLGVDEVDKELDKALQRLSREKLSFNKRNRSSILNRSRMFNGNLKDDSWMASLPSFNVLQAELVRDVQRVDYRTTAKAFWESGLAVTTADCFLHVFVCDPDTRTDEALGDSTMGEHVIESSSLPVESICLSESALSHEDALIEVSVESDNPLQSFLRHKVHLLFQSDKHADDWIRRFAIHRSALPRTTSAL